MILTKTLDELNAEFEFMDSMVTGFCWDTSMQDLLVTLDYFWDSYASKTDPRTLTIRFRNCQSASFSLPKAFDLIAPQFAAMSKSEYNSYIWSWHTITGYSFKQQGDKIEASIWTADHDREWLIVSCEEIWVEGDE